MLPSSRASWKHELTGQSSNSSEILKLELGETLMIFTETGLCLLHACIGMSMRNILQLFSIYMLPGWLESFPDH
jgi:hypothetical protein